MSYTPEQLRAAAAFKLMGDICASVDVREVLIEYADALDDLAKWQIAGYTEDGVLKCAADLKRERDAALDALQVAREALENAAKALDWAVDFIDNDEVRGATRHAEIVASRAALAAMGKP